MPNAELCVPGESAIVTASGRGIGRRIAATLAEHGVDVALNDTDEDALHDASASMESLPGATISVVGDASVPGDMQTLVDETVDAFGGVDVLVNNVGVAGPTESCEEISFEAFQRTLEVNLGGHFNATSAAIPHLRAADSGRVVSVSSMSGKRPLTDRVPYATTKMGAIGFVRTLAAELAADGVTVNAVCPGSVEGPRLEAVIEEQARSQGRTYEEVEAEFRSASPMGEFVQPEDIADAVLYLCSERAERVTGQDINVTAGACMY